MVTPHHPIQQIGFIFLNPLLLNSGRIPQHSVALIVRGLINGQYESLLEQANNDDAQFSRIIDSLIWSITARPTDWPALATVATEGGIVECFYCSFCGSKPTPKGCVTCEIPFRLRANEITVATGATPIIPARVVAYIREDLGLNFRSEPPQA